MSRRRFTGRKGEARIYVTDLGKELWVAVGEMELVLPKQKWFYGRTIRLGRPAVVRLRDFLNEWIGEDDE